MPARARTFLSKHWPLLILLALGVALRVTLLIGYEPAQLTLPDTWGYVKGAAEEIFVPDVRRPAGYAVFLRLLHDVWASISFVIVLQHVLGLATVVAAYALMLRAGANRWIALVPAAVACLSLDLIALEHQLLSETLFTALVTVGTLATFVGIGRTEREQKLVRGLAWLGLAGLVIAAAVTVRTAATFALLPFLVLIPLLIHARIRVRLAGLAAFALPAITLLLVYMVAQNVTTGYFGMVPSSGFNLYARAAPFANCLGFDPPRGTEALCETTDVRDRYGGDYYAWDPGNPAWRLGLPPMEAAPKLREFAMAAILGQPRAYIDHVSRDLWRFVVPYQPAPVGAGGTPDDLSIDVVAPTGEELNHRVIDPYYGRPTITRDGVVGTLAEWQKVLRMHGPLMLAALVFSLVGVFFATRLERRAILLCSAIGFLIPIVSVVTVIWGWRYAVPSQPAMAVAGTLGAVAIVRRALTWVHARRSESAPSGAPSGIGA